MPDEATPAAREPEPLIYRYAGKPARIQGHKAVFHLGGTDIVRARVQVLDPGKGETALHSHVAVDTFWMVLKGSARFYGEGDCVLADLGPQEGIITPRGLKYWFESTGNETLELLQITAVEKTLPNRVIYDKRPKAALAEYDRYVLNEERTSLPERTGNVKPINAG